MQAHRVNSAYRTLSCKQPYLPSHLADQKWWAFKTLGEVSEITGKVLLVWTVWRTREEFPYAFCHQNEVFCLIFTAVLSISLTNCGWKPFYSLVCMCEGCGSTRDLVNMWRSENNLGEPVLSIIDFRGWAQVVRFLLLYQLNWPSDFKRLPPLFLNLN